MKVTKDELWFRDGWYLGIKGFYRLLFLGGNRWKSNLTCVVACVYPQVRSKRLNDSSSTNGVADSSLPPHRAGGKKQVDDQVPGAGGYKVYQASASGVQKGKTERRGGER